MAITLQVPSPSGTEEFEVDLEEEILEQFKQKILGSLCYTYSWPWGMNQSFSLLLPGPCLSLAV